MSVRFAIASSKSVVFIIIMLLFYIFQLFKEISVHLDLAQVCSQFSQVRFYRGIVDLCLTAASRRDTQGLALHYYKNGEPPEDSQGRQGYMER